MNYPVDLTKKYVQYNIATQKAIKRFWPRADGMPIVGLDSNIVYLSLVEEEMPQINFDEELVINESADLENETFTISYSKRNKAETPEIVYKKHLKQGFLVEPENFYLGISEEDQNAFSRLLTLLNLVQATNETSVSVSDKSGELHTISFQRLKEIMISYGIFVQTIWLNYKNT